MPSGPCSNGARDGLCFPVLFGFTYSNLLWRLKKEKKKDDKHLKTERTTTFGDFLRGKFHFSYLGCGRRDGDDHYLPVLNSDPRG